MSNLQAMAKEGMRFRLKAPVTRWNESELDGIFAIADRFGVPIDCDPQITPRDNGDPSPMGLAPSPDGVKKLFRILEQRRLAKSGAVPGAVRPAAPEKEAAPSKHCGAGSSGLTVDPVGNVLACVQWRRPVGNLHRESIREIWASSLALGEIRKKSEEVAQFVRTAGPSVERSGYCPASAEQQTGSHVRLYPSVIRSIEGLNSIRIPDRENAFERGVALGAIPQQPGFAGDESAAGEA
jgi:MoaA/NifB/PqqE/SkfB family radical SAM enzyme